MDFPIKKIVIFHCYVSLPEGKFSTVASNQNRVASSSAAVIGCRGRGIRGKGAAEEEDVGLRGMNFLGCYQEKCQVHHGIMGIW